MPDNTLIPIQPHLDAPTMAEAMEGKARYAEIRGRKRSRVKRTRQLATLAALATVGAWVGLALPGLAFVAAAALVAVAAVYDRVRVRWTDAEYYALPATRMASGKHRCVHCGHSKVHLHKGSKGEQVADCPSCGSQLWVKRARPVSSGG